MDQSLIRSPQRAEESNETTGSKRAQAQLRVSEIRYRRLFETARDGILILAADTVTITDVNPYMVELLGYSRAEFLGKELWEIGLLKDAEASQNAYQELREKGYLRYEDLPLQAKDGKLRQVEFVSNVYTEDDHQVIQCNIRDITARKQAEEELRRLMSLEQAARAEAEAANRTKDEFLAIASHELRTPLNAILGWATLLCTGKFDEARTVRALETIQRNAKAQARLIEDLLDVSRLNAGILQLETSLLEIPPIIYAVIESQQPEINAKSIQLQTHLDPDLGLVSGDAHRLQQVIENLVANAIKFTPDGGQIEVRLERVNAQAQITVSDTGKGIKADFLPYVFEDFRQADSSTTREHGGLGLGLSIVHQIVALHGGTVQAESSGEGQGATLIVRLPLAAASQAASCATNGGQLPFSNLKRAKPFYCLPELSNLQVMTIDDHPDTLEMLRSVLEQGGAKVRTYLSTAAALADLTDWWPDVLISDIAMPDEDGYGIIGKVRAIERRRSKRIPALALTAYNTVEDRTRVLAAGFDRFVPKPVEPNELLATLANLVRESRKELSAKL